MTLPLPPLAAEELFKIGSWPITNTYVNSLIAVLIFIVFSIFLNRGIKKYYASDRAPKGIVNFFEGLLEFLLTYVDQVTQDHKKTLKFLPVAGGLFFFILVSNWLSLIPGTGSLGIWQIHNGAMELIPILRPANSDLNLTLAMAIFAVTASHFMGIISIGFFKYANKFIKLGDIFRAVKTLKPMNILISIIEFFVGLIEVFSEVAKMVSLSLRLFGNIFAGEVLLTVLAGLIAVAVPLPFIALEMLVGLIQALVFAMLALVYLVIATTPIHIHGEIGHGAMQAEVEENQTPAV